MSDRLKSMGFAVLLCLVCSFLLTAASSGLKRRQNDNIRIDKQKNILLSVSLISAQEKYSADDIMRLYSKNIQSFRVDSSGRMVSSQEAPADSLPVYLYFKDEHVEAYIVPIDSRGLWGRILGYLAIKNDGSTISGFTVYKHSETPGLGGEIERAWFQKNFVGKKIVDRNGEFVSIAIAKGSVKDHMTDDRRINYVDGISGATLTGKFLTAGLKDILLNYEPVSIRFRKNQMKDFLLEDHQNPGL